MLFAKQPAIDIGQRQLERECRHVDSLIEAGNRHGLVGKLAFGPAHPNFATGLALAGDDVGFERREVEILRWLHKQVAINGRG